MCGDYNSVIGMETNAPILRFTSKLNAHAKLTPASNKDTACVCGVVFEINRNGQCININYIRHGSTFLK